MTTKQTKQTKVTAPTAPATATVSNPTIGELLQSAYYNPADNFTEFTDCILHNITPNGTTRNPVTVKVFNNRRIGIYDNTGEGFLIVKMKDGKPTFERNRRFVVIWAHLDSAEIKRRANEDRHGYTLYIQTDTASGYSNRYGLDIAPQKPPEPTYDDTIAILNERTKANKAYMADDVESNDDLPA